MAGLPGHVPAPRRRGNALVQRRRCHCFLSPLHPPGGLCGSHPLLHGGGCVPLPVPVAALSRRPGLPLNTGLVRLSPAVVFPLSLEGSALYCRWAPALRPGPPLLSSWRTAVAGLMRAGDRRRTRVLDAARAWTGVQRGGSVPPHPSPVAALRCRSNGLLLPGCQAMFRPPVGAATHSNRCGALPHLAAPQGAPTCSCLRPAPVLAALPWHRRRRCGAGALAPPAPAITRGLPAPPRTAPPTPVAVRPYTPRDSRF